MEDLALSIIGMHSTKIILLLCFSGSVLFVNLPCGLSNSQTREMVPRLCHVKDKYLIGMCHLNMSTMNCVSGLKSCKAENGGRKEKFLEYFQMMKQTM